ncbi:MAG: SsrA-binding protein SmpB [Pseudomonadota bacterium]|nr:SsrA-binding protein SmpB [Pseudomonadota bacterium]
MANSKKSKNKAKSSSGTGVIALNRKSSHLYHLEDRLEAGLQLSGWEVKSLRDGRAQISESYIIIRKGQAWLLNAHFTPLTSASTHVVAEPERTRKLLLHKREISKLAGKIKEVGYTIVPTKLYWKNNMVKLEIAMAKGKKEYDKRQSLKTKDWERQKGIIMKKSQR